MAVVASLSSRSGDIMAFFGGSVGQGIFQGMDQLQARQIRDQQLMKMRLEAQKAAQQNALKGPASNALFQLLAGGGEQPTGAPQNPMPLPPQPGQASQPMQPPGQSPAVPGGMPGQVPGMAPPGGQPAGAGMGPVMPLPTMTRPGDASQVLKLLQAGPDEAQQLSPIDKPAMSGPTGAPAATVPPEPYRALPSGPGPAGAPPGQPPQMPAGDPPGPMTARKPEGIRLPDIAKSLIAAGVPKEHLIDALELLSPVMNTANQQEMNSIKIQHQLAMDTVKFQEERIKELTESRKDMEGRTKAIQADRAEDRKEAELEAKKDKWSKSEERLREKNQALYGEGGIEREKLEVSKERADAYRDRIKQLSDNEKKMLGAEGGTPEQYHGLVSMAASGAPLSQIVRGYGKQASALAQKVQLDAIKYIQEQAGMTPEQAGEELASRQSDYVAGRRSETQLVTMKGATVAAVDQIEYNVNQVKDILKNAPDLADLSPVINAIRMGVEKWTGDPQYSALYYYMNAVATESARILSGGQASIAQLHEGAREEANKWANINMTPKAFIDGVAPAMLAEGKKRVEIYDKAIGGTRSQPYSRGAKSGPGAETDTGGSQADKIPGQAAAPSQEDLEFTAKKHGMTVEQVKKKLGIP